MQTFLRLLICLSVVVIGFGTVASASSNEEIRVPIVILVDADLMRTDDAHCYIQTEDSRRHAQLTAAPTPFGELESDSTFGGRVVTAKQSPIEGQEGCLLEYRMWLPVAESYEFNLILDDLPNDWSINMGDLDWEFLKSAESSAVIYHIDSEVLESREMLPIDYDIGVEATPAATPGDS